MRTGLSRAAVALVATALWFATDLAPVGFAAPSEPTAPGTVGDPLTGAAAPWALGREDLRIQIDATSQALQVADDRRAQLDRNLEAASTATDELRTETLVMGEETLRYAIQGYQHSEIPTGLLASADLTASIRATALGGAAVSADTEGFDAYRELIKDLEIEEEELQERELEVVYAAAEVDILQTTLTDELLIFGDMEERRLQNTATVAQTSATNRASARGNKPGSYLDVCPVDGDEDFIDSWGFQRSGGRRHQGVDIMAPYGTPVVAPVNGRVEHYNNSLGGLSYRLFGPRGLYLYGTHLSRFGAQGEVTAGTVIGYVGQSGNAAGTPPHLHFEIHPGGRGSPAINPYPDSAAVCSGAH